MSFLSLCIVISLSGTSSKESEERAGDFRGGADREEIKPLTRRDHKKKTQRSSNDGGTKLCVSDNAVHAAAF